MRHRCRSTRPQDRPYYLDKGVKVCPEWDASFERFLADVGPRPSADHTLDRIDSDRGYAPGNVRWVTRKVQQQNRSTTRWLTVDGLRLCLSDWEKRTGLPVRRRINRGWDAKRAVTEPAHNTKMKP